VSGPAPWLPWPLAEAASWVYGRAIAGRNRRYDRTGGRRLPVPVISVGNITVGGTGKTPFVRHLAAMLLQRGREPVIAMRGYGSRGGMSDEQAEYAEDLPQVDVVADPDRFTAVSAYLAHHPQTSCVILDDGFQHRQLHRDLDLVLVSARQPPAEQRLLPAGYLREPATSLRRADAVIVTHTQQIDPRLAQMITDLHGRAPLAWSRHVWHGLRLFDAERGQTEAPAEWLTGRKVVTLLGVAQPQGILDQLAAEGASIAAHIAARDHERYSSAKLGRLWSAAADADAVVLTGKDWVKVREVIDWRTCPAPIVVPEVSIEILDGREALEARVLAAVG